MIEWEAENDGSVSRKNHWHIYPPDRDGLCEIEIYLDDGSFEYLYVPFEALEHFVTAVNIKKDLEE